MLEKKDLLLLRNELIEKMPDLGNAKEHYQSFTRKKSRKSRKKIRNNYISTKKSCKRPNTVHIKSVITELSKTS